MSSESSYSFIFQLLSIGGLKRYLLTDKDKYSICWEYAIDKKKNGNTEPFVVKTSTNEYILNQTINLSQLKFEKGAKKRLLTFFIRDNQEPPKRLFGKNVTLNDYLSDEKIVKKEEWPLKDWNKAHPDAYLIVQITCVPDKPIVVNEDFEDINNETPTPPPSRQKTPSIETPKEVLSISTVDMSIGNRRASERHRSVNVVRNPSVIQSSENLTKQTVEISSDPSSFSAGSSKPVIASDSPIISIQNAEVSTPTSSYVTAAEDSGDNSGVDSPTPSNQMTTSPINSGVNGGGVTATASLQQKVHNRSILIPPKRINVNRYSTNFNAKGQSFADITGSSPSSTNSSNDKGQSRNASSFLSSIPQQGQQPGSIGVEDFRESRPVGVWTGDTEEYRDMVWDSGDNEPFIRFGNPLYNVEENYGKQEDNSESLSVIQKKLDDMEEHVRDLEAENKAMKAALDNYRYPKRGDKGERVEDPAFVKRENDQLKVVVENLKAKLKDLHIKNDSDFESMKIESREKDSDIDNFQRLYRKTNAELQTSLLQVDQMQRECETLRESLKEKNELIEKFMSQTTDEVIIAIKPKFRALGQMEQDLEKMRLKMDEALLKKEELSNKKVELDRLTEKLSQELKLAQEKGEESDNLVKNLQTELEKVLADMKIANDRVLELKAENKKLETSFEREQEHNSRHKEIIAQMKTDGNFFMEKIVALETHVRDLQGGKEIDFTPELRNLEAKIQLLETEKKQMEADNNENNSKFKDKMKKLQLLNDTLTMESMQVEKKWKEDQDRFYNLQREMITQNSINYQKQAKIYMRNVGEMKDKLDQSTALVHKLTREIEDMKEEVKKRTRAEINILSELNTIREQLRKVTSEKVDLTFTLQKLEEFHQKTLEDLKDAQKGLIRKGSIIGEHHHHPHLPLVPPNLAISSSSNTIGIGNNSSHNAEPSHHSGTFPPNTPTLLKDNLSTNPTAVVSATKTLSSSTTTDAVIEDFNNNNDTALMLSGNINKELVFYIDTKSAITQEDLDVNPLVALKKGVVSIINYFQQSVEQKQMDLKDLGDGRYNPEFVKLVVQCLCEPLNAVFQHGFIGKSWPLFPLPGQYSWQLLEEISMAHPFDGENSAKLHSAVETVNVSIDDYLRRNPKIAVPEPSKAKLFSFIFYCLNNESLLQSQMKFVLLHHELLHKYYRKEAILLDPEGIKKLLKFIGLINYLPFSLEICSHLTAVTESH